jgi:FkbM family methyltransferase
MRHQRFDVQRVGATNIFSIADDPDLASYKICLRRHTSDIPVFRQVFLAKGYKMLIDRIRKDGCERDTRFIVDAGANIGCSTLYLKKVFSGATIVSVEPEEGNYHCLVENIRLNALTDVIPVRAGVWIDEGRLAVDKSTGDRREWAYSVVPTASGAQTIPAVTIRALMTRYGESCIDILKIDIEGAERFIFDDAERLRSFLPAVRYLVMEIHEDFISKQHITGLLERFGFSYFFSGELIVACNTKIPFAHLATAPAPRRCGGRLQGPSPVP